MTKRNELFHSSLSINAPEETRLKFFSIIFTTKKSTEILLKVETKDSESTFCYFELVE